MRTSSANSGLFAGNRTIAKPSPGARRAWVQGAVPVLASAPPPTARAVPWAADAAMPLSTWSTPGSPARRASSQ